MMLVGTRDGSIWSGDKGVKGEKRMSSHSDGEVWGLDVTDGKVFTSGDDNKVMCWDPVKRACEAQQHVSKETTTVKRGASTLSNLPAAQQSRAIAVNADFCVISTNVGFCEVRANSNMAETVHTLSEP